MYRTYRKPLAILTFVGIFFLGLNAVMAENTAIKSVSKSKEKWWAHRHESMNHQVAKGNVDLIFIGDSITHQWEKEKVGKPVWKTYYAKRNAVNLGISGDRTEHVLWRLENGNLKGISPKLAVVMIGTNNRIPQNTPEETAEGITQIVKKLRTDLPETKVLLLGIFPRGKTASDPRNLGNKKVNTIIEKLADGENVFYLDFGEVSQRQRRPHQRDHARLPPPKPKRLRNLGRSDRAVRRKVCRQKEWKIERFLESLLAAWLPPAICIHRRSTSRFTGWYVVSKSTSPLVFFQPNRGDEPTRLTNEKKAIGG